MKKTREEMLITREQVLKSAFDCFYEKGFEKTSLEEIARRAGVTRGAIYWHFNDKLELYRAVANLTFAHGSVSSFGDELGDNMTLVDRISAIFWRALDNNKYVDYVFKTINYISGNDEFADIYQIIRDEKKELLHFLEKEIIIYCVTNGVDKSQANMLAKELFTLFEGMFLIRNVSIGIELNEEFVRFSVENILSDIIV